LKQKVKGPAAQVLYFAMLKLIMIEENVILVDKDDQPIGLMPKLEAHEKRFASCFSVFVLNSKNEIMLQQRAHQKYHSPPLFDQYQPSKEGESNTRW
jgi:isopentenyl-diphosphate delta-isomerase